MDASKKLYKNKSEGKIAGVCAGFAEYFGADVTLVRIAWALVVLAAGTGIFLYIVCALIMTEKSDLYTNKNNY